MKKKIVIVTGSLGLIGFEVVRLLLDNEFIVIGIDNDFRSKLFKINTNFHKKKKYLLGKYENRYLHFGIDIRNNKKIEKIFMKYGAKVYGIVHTAAQTSHDWAQNDPLVDFSINAQSTLFLLENTRKYASDAVFIYTSTNKVYGDLVNTFPLQEFSSRFDLKSDHPCYVGVDESLSIDNSMHSLFGISKLSADLLVQEYGKYFHLKTIVLRLGVVTGALQNGAIFQGFISYLINQCMSGKQFNIFGFKGKQVRDIIHASDVARAIWYGLSESLYGEVFNLGGGRENSFSLIEIISFIENVTGKKMKIKKKDGVRKGDHKWWITNTAKFKQYFPEWRVQVSVMDIIKEFMTAHDFSG